FTWLANDFYSTPDDVFLSLAISPDGKTLASGDGKGIILLWDLAGEGPEPWRANPTALARLWEGLANRNAKEAWPVMRELIARPAAAIRLIRAKVAAPPSAPGAARLAALLKQLDA